MVPSATLREENLHAFCHVDPQESVGVSNNGSTSCQQGRFEDSIILQVLLSEGLNPQIPLDHKGTIKSSENTKQDIKQQLKEVPVVLILDLEHDQLASSEGIHSSKDSCCDQSTEVTAP